MKKTKIIAIMCAAIIFAGNKPVYTDTIQQSKHYTWGLDNNQLAINDGCIITDAVLTFHNITNAPKISPINL